MKLSDYQNQIYKNDKNIIELHEKNLVLKKEAAKSIKERDEGKAKKLATEISKNSLKSSEIGNNNIVLSNKLEEKLSILKSKINESGQNPVTKASQKELADAKEEIEKHSKLVAQHQKELQKESQAKKLKKEGIYKEEKSKLYKTASNFIGDPASLNDILVPLAEKKGTKESVGLGDIVSSGLSAFGFALQNAGSVIDIAGSAAFYKEEAAKIPMGKGVKEDMSFFLQLLDDPESVKFLAANSAKLAELVETIAPTLISIGIRELSKLPELEERLSNDKKKQGSLESLEDKLKKLEAKITSNELDNQQIAEFAEQIGNRKLLEQRISLAKTVDALDKAGINTNYIEKKLLPIAINPIKEILKNPKDIIDVANASLDIVLQNDPQKTKDSLRLIASKIDIGVLIGSSGLQDFLATEGNSLSSIATIVIANNDTVKTQVDKLGITPEIVQQVIPAVTQIASAALTDAKKLTEAYNEIVTSSSKLLNITSKEKAQKEIDISNLSKEEIKAFDAENEVFQKQKSEVLSEMVGSASKVVLQDNLLNSVRNNVSGLLENNQAAITGMITHNLGKLDKASLPGQILASVSPDFTTNTTKAVTGLVSTILNETTNDQIKDLINSGKGFLTASKEEIPKIVQDLAKQGMAILVSSQVAESLKNVGTTLVNSSDDISKIAVKALSSTDLKDIFTEVQIKDSMPMVTKAIGAILNSSQEIVTIATESQKLLASLDKTTQGLTNKQYSSVGMTIDSLSKIVTQSGISETLTKDLPAFLEKNKENIPDIAANLLKNVPALSTLRKEMGISDDLVKDVAKLGADLLIDAAPMVDKFARATLKEKDQLVTIISDVRDLTNAPKENQKAAVLKVVSNIISLKESNTDLKSIFDKELPDLLEKNQEQLAKVIDGVIQTKAGSGLKLETEKIIKIVAANLPAVTKLADLYSKGKYAEMFPEIVKLAFKKDVLSTAIGTLSTINKHTAEKKKDSQTVEGIEGIKERMSKHVISSDRASAIISKDKQRELSSQHKGK